MAEPLKKLTSYEEIIEFSILLTDESETIEWKKLQDKTQVFNTRVSDSVKSRGSHSIDVGDIAAELASGLTTDLAAIEKARLLGRLHDIGHIPFGHAGESIADSIIKERYSHFSEEEKAAISTIRTSLFGSSYASKNKKPAFEHNENSVLQYHLISQRLGYEADPEIVEGILAHSTSRYPELPTSLVQQAVRLADKIAYINYDVEDLRLSFQGKEEWQALETIYARPILDEENKPIVIEYNGKQYTNVLEFINSLEVSERLAIFESEAIRMALEDGMNKSEQYVNHETVLTGGNDLIVKLSRLKKESKYYNKETKEWTPEGIAERKRIKKELLRKSPILYLSYEMKERSDEFIRAGTGLTVESQKERSEKAQSAVGNEDLRNQYIYNKLVTFIENRHKIDLNLLPPSLQTTFKTFFAEYEQYKVTQENLIANLPGNENKVQYPEIYTILNFIGSHSNTELLTLAHTFGLNAMFEKEVLAEMHQLMSNEAYYDKETATFTAAGLEERDKIVSKYGAFLKFQYGIEEYDFTPTTSEMVIEAAKQYGYQEEHEPTTVKKEEKKETTEVTKNSNLEALQNFNEQEKRTEQALMMGIQQTIALQNEQQLAMNGVSHGR